MRLILMILSVWFVTFVDKPEKSAPQLSERAVEQRAKWGIPTDAMDYPVSPLYMGELTKRGIKIYHKSRWFNGVTVEMDDETAEKVKGLKFVKDVELTRDNSPKGDFYMKHKVHRLDEPGLDETISYTDRQLELYNLLPLHKAGYDGQGILMTICDGGFYNAQEVSFFRQKELELGHFDFTDDTDDFYGSTGSHGTQCLSTISGITEGYYGAATKAQYYLMRSEETEHESPKEMDNLVAALETADSLGVNIFSVSLGYIYFDNSDWNLPYSSMNGKTTRASRAASIAARKGMLVCAAAGNEGNSEWQKICVPADADSILTVGAVDTLGFIGSFSSYGPSSDGRVKPDVCAVGVKTTLITPQGTLVNSNGTSFACPLMAGMAACLWSALPDENAMQIRERILRSADRYTNPDTVQYGYGIPDAWKAYTMTLPMGVDEGLKAKGERRKVLRDGRLWIQVGERWYNVLGAEVQ